MPLSQLQAMKRCSEARQAGGGAEKYHPGTTGSISSVGSQGHCTPLPEQDNDHPPPRALEATDETVDADLDPAVDSRLKGDEGSTENHINDSKDLQR